MTATPPTCEASRTSTEGDDDSEHSETVGGLFPEKLSLRESLQEPLVVEFGKEREEPIIHAVSDSKVPARRSSRVPSKSNRTSAKEGLYDSSLALAYNPAIVDYVSSGHIRPRKTLKRRHDGSTSTIFLNSPSAPVTIIVTTPEEDSPDPPASNSFQEIRARRTGSVTCPPPYFPRKEARMSTESLFTPDTSRLMPPTEHQLNQSLQYKGREFHEARKFIIMLLNAKGDQLPEKLRLRMQNMYLINESDLDPSVVARFTSDPSRDEGVALASEGYAGTEADDFRILERAFRSQMPATFSQGQDEKTAGLGLMGIPQHRDDIRNGRDADETQSLAFDPSGPRHPSHRTQSEPSTPIMDAPLPEKYTHRLFRSRSVPNIHRKKSSFGRLFLVSRHERAATIEEAPPLPTLSGEFLDTKNV
jgi:hypothetical protein